MNSFQEKQNNKLWLKKNKVLLEDSLLDFHSKKKKKKKMNVLKWMNQTERKKMRGESYLEIGEHGNVVGKTRPRKKKKKKMFRYERIKRIRWSDRWMKGEPIFFFFSFSPFFSFLILLFFFFFCYFFSSTAYFARFSFWKDQNDSFLCFLVLF